MGSHVEVIPLSIGYPVAWLHTNNFGSPYAIRTGEPPGMEPNRMGTTSYPTNSERITTKWAPGDTWVGTGWSVAEWFSRGEGMFSVSLPPPPPDADGDPPLVRAYHNGIQQIGIDLHPGNSIHASGYVGGGDYLFTYSGDALGLDARIIITWTLDDGTVVPGPGPVVEYPEGAYPGWGDTVGDWNMDDWGDWDGWNDFDDYNDWDDNTDQKSTWTTGSGAWE